MFIFIWLSHEHYVKATIKQIIERFKRSSLVEDQRPEKYIHGGCLQETNDYVYESVIEEHKVSISGNPVVIIVFFSTELNNINHFELVQEMAANIM